MSVDYPEEKVMVFDVETLVCEGNFAVLAIALSPHHWFVISMIYHHLQSFISQVFLV